jgi:hypothetical protein
MNAEDKARLASGFDREAWATLWDRLPERMRRGVLRFILHLLHAVESRGAYSIRWHYVTAEEREEANEPIQEADEADQPGDLIKLTGEFRIGFH